MSLLVVQIRILRLPLHLLRALSLHRSEREKIKKKEKPKQLCRLASVLPPHQYASPRTMHARLIRFFRPMTLDII